VAKSPLQQRTNNNRNEEGSIGATDGDITDPPSNKSTTIKASNSTILTANTQDIINNSKCNKVLLKKEESETDETAIATARTSRKPKTKTEQIPSMPTSLMTPTTKTDKANEVNKDSDDTSVTSRKQMERGKEQEETAKNQLERKNWSWKATEATTKLTNERKPVIEPEYTINHGWSFDVWTWSEWNSREFIAANKNVFIERIIIDAECIENEIELRNNDPDHNDKESVQEHSEDDCATAEDNDSATTDIYHPEPPRHATRPQTDYMKWIKEYFDKIEARQQRQEAENSVHHERIIETLL
jgi:hypothetical protein